ncbi:unnamed protein product [Dovyalis caffra]|uniref:Uncharacterized protein n=1 Tax=Dovyalis caffra TaxID=77055 RepID=A0AAV1SF48_9ROSI|nr:unnamed protein product [Dovyalis caffra]
MNLGFTEGYLVKVFIGGLKGDLGWRVKRFKPVDLGEAFEQAKLNEALRKPTPNLNKLPNIHHSQSHRPS